MFKHCIFVFASLNHIQKSSVILTDQMNLKTENTSTKKWLHITFAAGLLISFFLPWVCWKDSWISGYDMPTERFFHIAESKFGLGNPFPQLSFTFNLFWLIPALSLFIIVLVIRNKKTIWPAFITSSLALGLLSIFFLFTRDDLAIETNLFRVLSPAGWLAAVSAGGLILTVLPSSALYKKAGWLLVGPLFAFFSHMFVVNYYNNATFSNTSLVKADYTINATDLIHEFAVNDSAANNKYREKILIVNGTAGDVETKGDSTVNIKFTDTTGSYIIFSLDKDQIEKAKIIKQGDRVSLKGSCSGSVYSEVLSTTSISFKRAILNKQ